MTILADELSNVASCWWQSKAFVDATFKDVSESDEDEIADYQVVHEFEFQSMTPDSLSVSVTVYDNCSFGLALLWRSRVACVAGFEMGGEDADGFAALLDLVSTGRFLIDERGSLHRWAGIHSKAVLNAEDARLLTVFGPKGWLRKIDDVLPWRRAKLLQTAGWR